TTSRSAEPDGGVDRADVVLLSGAEDDAIADYFIGEAFPPEQVMREVLGAVEAEDGVGNKKVEAAVNVKGNVIERSLKILEVEGAVTKENGGWSRTVNSWDPNRDRVEAVTDARYRELEQMRQFVDTG